jgi:hypothetical protein
MTLTRSRRVPSLFSSRQHLTLDYQRPSTHKLTQRRRGPFDNVISKPFYSGAESLRFSASPRLRVFASLREPNSAIHKSTPSPPPKITLAPLAPEERRGEGTGVRGKRANRHPPDRPAYPFRSEHHPPQKPWRLGVNQPHTTSPPNILAWLVKTQERAPQNQGHPRGTTCGEV